VRILNIHKFFYEKGGAERYLFDLAGVFAAHGHENIFFATKGPQSLPYEHDDLFPPEINLNARHGLMESARIAARFVYSFSAQEALERLLDREPVDAAFVHNIYHHLTPSILRPLRKRRIPTLLHVADYKLICPSYRLYTQGTVCERCKKLRFYNAVRYRCVKDSTGKSALAALEAYFQRVFHLYENGVDFFIAPSRFLRQKLIEFGLSAAKVVHQPQALDLSGFRPSGRPGEYILFAGILLREKGIGTLVEAMRRFPGERLLVAGDGPYRQEVEQQIREHKLTNVTLLGFQPQERIPDLMANCKFLVVPSEWYETFGLVIYEALACGRPVVGANLGGIPELIPDGLRGRLFQPGDVDSLADAMMSLLGDPSLRDQMGEEGLHFVREFSPERNYQGILELFRRAGVPTGQPVGMELTAPHKLVSPAAGER
jgi:glycosyltransferase involved in cell wall biosynthesis